MDKESEVITNGETNGEVNGHTNGDSHATTNGTNGVNGVHHTNGTNGTLTNGHGHDLPADITHSAVAAPAS